MYKYSGKHNPIEKKRCQTNNREYVPVIDIINYTIRAAIKKLFLLRTRGNNAITQRVAWVLSVTMGDKLQRPAAYKQLWSVIMSDPEYGDLCVKTVY